MSGNDRKKTPRQQGLVVGSVPNRLECLKIAMQLRSARTTDKQLLEIAELFNRYVTLGEMPMGGGATISGG